MELVIRFRGSAWLPTTIFNVLLRTSCRHWPCLQAVLRRELSRPYDIFPPPLTLQLLIMDPRVARLLSDAHEYSQLVPGPVYTQYQQLISSLSNSIEQFLSTKTLTLFPTELLCTIFSYACATDPHTDPPLQGNLVMIATPMIIAGGKDSDKLERLVERFAERSQTAPLSIRLRFPPPRILRRLSNIIIPLLIPHATRWRHLALNLSSGNIAPLYTMFDLAVTGFPMLETLTLEDLARGTSNVCDGFASATTLKHIQFKGGVLHPLLYSLLPKLGKQQTVKTVVLQSVPYGRLIPTIGSLFNVERLVLQDMKPDAAQQQGFSLLRTNLRWLTVVFGEISEGVVFSSFLAALEMPQLRTLEVVEPYPMNARTFIPGCLTSFVVRSEAAKLRKLILKGVVMWASELIGLLEVVPLLEELVVHESREKPTIWHGFEYGLSDDIEDAPHPVSEMFCLQFSDEEVAPKLKVLELMWFSELDETKLENVTLGMGPFAHTTYERMRLLTERGTKCFASVA
ncbi:hypothetical protein IW261DRAFT_1507874 [Armillaria novae-zelandiae]|uniref:Uncharacterized protein n=1 Tax=Armillaria novae-zelandiae TaxID=153914 RepID=A0AA39NVA5_9AGAR|nr:hypothetical protein IW261DRAFT_1507874 [Armillaria novae-zelandiae]